MQRSHLLTLLLPLLIATGCRPGTRAPEPGAEGVGARDRPAGWEGFFPPGSLDDAWLDDRGIDLDAATVRSVADRVVKLSLDDGEREAPAAQLAEMQRRYCEPPDVRAWNEDRCRALEQRRCTGETCRYEHFGNCSGILLGGGILLTAAHCVAALMETPQRKARSAVLRPGPDGLPARRLPLGAIRAAKRDFGHHWVVVEPAADPVDVAAVGIDDGGLNRMPVAALPARGEPVFIVGYPRVEGRRPEDLQTAGYRLTFGTPSVSFGRLVDPNQDDHPLCNVDGNQEHWALRSECPTGPAEVDGQSTWRGVITRSPFLAGYDSCNGYSGGPVFDARGRLTGVNVTLMSKTDPQERFDPAARMIAIPATRAIERLGLQIDSP